MAQNKISLERLHHIWILVFLGSCLLFFRLVDLQIIRHKYFKHAAEVNRTLVIYKNAPRGKIITADNVVIAANQPSFSLVYLPASKKDDIYLKKLSRDLAGELNINSNVLDEKFQKAFDKNMPVRISEHLPLKAVFLFSEIKTSSTGIELVKETRRYYPYKNFASHIVGYIGKMNNSSWQRLKGEKNYRFDSYIGRSGLEKMFEDYLKGYDGGLYLEVDSRGKLTNIIDDEKWHAGSDLHLTLDFETQSAAEKGLADCGFTGTVVVLNPQNGEILALANTPDFDPNIFVNRIGYTGDLAEFNYAVQGLYEPASVFKIIVAAAALETGSVNAVEKIYCPGYYDAGSRVFRCWEKEGHGRINMVEAIAHSCDVYFYQAGLRTGPSIIEKFARGFRLGMLTGIPIPGEKKGNVFGPSRRAKKRSYWFNGDTLNLSIGQGELLVTPLQMAQVISAVANGGKFWRPHFVEKIVSPDGKVLFRKKLGLLSSVNLKPHTWEVLKKGLLNTVNKGTGQFAKIEGVNVYGKTGTAQNPRGPEHGWFVAFAEIPPKKSSVAVCVFLEHGKHGYLAAPIAKNVIKAALRI